MREELRILVDEFYSHRNAATEHTVIQARELRSIQNAIKATVSTKCELTDEEWKAIVPIIFIDDEWWVTG